ncbi:MAG: ABC transporter permease [Candidatus Electrothrix sp. ATG2]|nr:ABC transporter permease [Candidatus Electrothrix sp. ATG2]
MKENKKMLANASQWRLMWMRFKRHKLALVSAIFLVVLYSAALVCGFVAPYNPDWRNVHAIQAPPQGLHFVRPDGSFNLRPFVYGYVLNYNKKKWWERNYSKNSQKVYPIRFFCKGQKYKLWNLIETDTHLFTVEKGGYIHLAGTDRLGRDMFSRIMYGARISLTIGLVGVVLTFILGVTLGGIAGYIGGWVDALLQRSIEILKSIPDLPLLMTLSAAVPVTWSPLMVYFGITTLLSFFNWMGLARVVRSKFLSLRGEDFVVAARLLGASRSRIVFKHLLPLFMSHIITSATLSIPEMILGETMLSFLGIGLRPPVVSWGVLLQQAQNYQAVMLTPWLLIPGGFVVAVVLAFNLLGDGLRDAADPYTAR